MKVNYLAILREAFDGESISRFNSYHSLAEIKSKLVTSPAPDSLTSSSRDSSMSIEEEPSHSTCLLSPPPKAFQLQSYRREFRLSRLRKGQERQERKQHKKQPQTIESTFNSLTGEEVFKIYSDSKFFTDLLTNKGQYPREIDQLLWRITYLVGEVIMHAQNSSSRTSPVFLREINRAAFRIVELQLNKRNQIALAQLSKVKIMMLEIFQKGGCNTEEERVISEFLNKVIGLNYTEKQTQTTFPPQRLPSISQNKSTQTDGQAYSPKLAAFAENYANYLELPSPSSLQPSQMQVSQVAAYTPEAKQRLRQSASNFQPNFKNYSKLLPKKKSNRASSGAIPPPKLYKEKKIQLDKPKSQVWTPFTQSTSKVSNYFESQNNKVKTLQSFNQSNFNMDGWGLQGRQQWRGSFSGKGREGSVELSEKFGKNSLHHPQKPNSSNQYLANNTLQGANPREANPQSKPRRRGRQPKKAPHNDQDLLVLQASSSSLNVVSDKSKKIGLKATIGKKHNGSQGQVYNRNSNTFEIDLNQDEPQINFRNEIVSSPASIQPIVVPTIAFSQELNHHNRNANQNQAQDKQSFGKKMREKWTPEQENLLVATFIESGDEDKCVGALEGQFGQHPKWSSSGVKLRLDWIVRKVYEKFKSLKTKNESINKFKQNWEFISKNASSGVRTKLYRDIVTIYTAMLNMSEQKRDVISKKILEINRTCQIESKA